MQSEQQQRIMGYFIEEAKDHLNTIEQGLLNLQRTIGEPDLVNEVFRAAHSVKGGAAMLGLDSIHKTAHRLEDYFKVLKECPVQVDQKLESYFLRVFDCLQDLLEQLQGPFGLTEDNAAQIMGNIEPVLVELNSHLSALVNQSGFESPTEVDLLQESADISLDQPEPVALNQPPYTETSALQLYFQSDVPAQLRRMLTLFKEADTDETRQQLQGICSELAQAGESFDLPNGWFELATLAQRAIANPDNDFRSLASALIKDFKQAQNLVLEGQARAILPSPELQNLQPLVDPLMEVEPVLSSDDMLDDISDIFDMDAGDISTPDENIAIEDLDRAFADLKGLEADDTSLQDAFDLFNEAAPEIDSQSVSDDSLSASSSHSGDNIDSVLDDIDAELNMADGIHQAGEFSSKTGPQVGITELNSLADLFENEASGLDMDWQDEIIDDSSDLLDDGLALEKTNDFSDLLIDDAPSESNLADENDSSPLLANSEDKIEQSDSSRVDVLSESDEFADLFAIGNDSDNPVHRTDLNPDSPEIELDNLNAFFDGIGDDMGLESSGKQSVDGGNDSGNDPEELIADEFESLFNSDFSDSLDELAVELDTPLPDSLLHDSSNLLNDVSEEAVTPFSQSDPFENEDVWSTPSESEILNDLSDGATYTETSHLNSISDGQEDIQDDHLLSEESTDLAFDNVSVKADEGSDNAPLSDDEHDVGASSFDMDFDSIDEIENLSDGTNQVDESFQEVVSDELNQDRIQELPEELMLHHSEELAASDGVSTTYNTIDDLESDDRTSNFDNRSDLLESDVESESIDVINIDNLDFHNEDNSSLQASSELSSTSDSGDFGDEFNPESLTPVSSNPLISDEFQNETSLEADVIRSEEVNATDTSLSASPDVNTAEDFNSLDNLSPTLKDNSSGESDSNPFIIETRDSYEGYDTDLGRSDDASIPLDLSNEISDDGAQINSVSSPITEGMNEHFDDLEALLDEPREEAANLEIHTALNAGSDLMMPFNGSSEEESDEHDFSDLEKLLEDADQKLGGVPTVKSSRGSAQPSTRRQARRSGGFGDQTMRVTVKNLDNLNNLVGELVVNRNSLEQSQERLRQFLDNLLYQVQQLSDVGQRMRDLYERSLLESSLLSSRRNHQLANQEPEILPALKDSMHATGASFDALEMDRFTGFHTLSQEMIELIVRVREAASDIDFVIDESDQITRMFRQVTTQLQEGLTRSRMVPFAQAASRLPRAVREISIRCGKQAELIVEGKDTLIDKMILEHLYDPMTHLVNNAITHGIESPEERQASNKSPIGKITIRVFHQGNQTIISVTDDGAGIDPENIRSKAIQRGLISPEEAQSMSRLDIFDLIFNHGFSTRDQADDYAGRGVGMDVVRTSLNEIRGVINIDSGIGQGTTFTIRLPLTLSISKALLCVSNRAHIAFPMDGVEDMLDVPRERLQIDEEGQYFILWREIKLPFRPLSDLLKYHRVIGRGSVYGGNQEEDVISIVVLRSAGNYLALQVDQVLGEQEIVIKQLEAPIPKPSGIAGATVLGDGRIMPIADVLELIDLSMGRFRREVGSSLWDKEAVRMATITADEAKSEPTVLIVDDSITVRELLSMTFNKVGYRVEQARDGQEAWEKLKSGLPCELVFCDIEMPRMDGLELLSRLQKDPNLKNLPIAMLTSRGADRHRQMAIQLGAKGYFTKPYLEEALLDAAQRMLNGEVLINVSSG